MFEMRAQILKMQQIKHSLPVLKQILKAQLVLALLKMNY